VHGVNVLGVADREGVPRRNRVTPYGELIAVADRGMFWGNRGAIVDGAGQLARYSRGKAWLICVLSYKGIRRGSASWHADADSRVHRRHSPGERFAPFRSMPDLAQSGNRKIVRVAFRNSGTPRARSSKGDRLAAVLWRFVPHQCG
jgi:hypothetical protein